MTLISFPLRYALVLGSLVAAFPALADTYTGTIEEVVTSSTYSGYSVGQTFTGSYSYVSTSTDGMFSSDPYSSGNGSLVGSIYMAGYAFTFIEGDPPGEITVQNGAVTSFAFGEDSPLDQDFYQNLTFDWYFFNNYGNTYLGGTSGYLIFSPPADTSAAVPETGATIAYLSASLLALGIGGAAFIKRPVAVKA